jgi:hypothetical protein
VRKIVYSLVSSLVIVSAAMPAKAETLPFMIAQQDSTIQRMFRELRVVTDDMQTMMTQMKMMMAEMKALTSVSAGKSATTNDLYRQQQVLIGQMEMLIGRTKLDTLLPRTISTVTVQEVHQQQQVMITEIKAMMTEMKAMMAAYRGRATDRR